MKEILRSIGILILLVLLGNLILIIPDFSDGNWIYFGSAGGSLFAILFGFVPVLLLILLDLDIIDVYALPLSDLLDESVKYVLYISVIITSITCSCFTSSLTNAISLILTVFVVFFPLYLFYDDIVRVRIRVKNVFLNRYLPSAVLGGAVILSIGLSYFLTLFDTYLPGDLFLAFGTTSFMDGIITIPTLYLYSVGACLVFFLYVFIVGRIIPSFKPKTEYKYATYGSEYISCKNCQFYKSGRCDLGFTERTIGANGVICYDYKRKR